MNTFQINDLVQIAAMPVTVIADRTQFPDTFDLFERAIGNSFHIRSFNEIGMAEFWLNEDASEDSSGSRHSIWVENEYLSKVD